MGGVRIKNAEIGVFNNFEAPVSVHGDVVDTSIETLVREVLAVSDPARAAELARRLDAQLACSVEPVTAEMVEAEARRQLEDDPEAPGARKPVADALGTVATGAAGGVLSQGLWFALRGLLGI